MAFTATTTSGGKTPGPPGARAVLQALEAFGEEALAPPRHRDVAGVLQHLLAMRPDLHRHPLAVLRFPGLAEDALNRRFAFAAMVVAASAVAIIAAFLLLRPPPLYPGRIAHYTVGADGRELTVSVAMGRLETIESTKIEESATTVKVIVLVSRRSGTAQADLQLVDVQVALASPLSARTVVDASDTPVPVKVGAP